MVEVRKKNGESVESLLRRFTKKVQQSGILIRAKKGRFFEPKKSRLEVKEGAIRRNLIREKKDYLRKIGKLDDILEQRRFGKKEMAIIKKMLGAKLKR